MSMNFFPFKLLLCLFSGISTVICTEYDYTKVDYCPKDMHCEMNAANSGCECKSNPGVNEITTDLNEFRKVIVDTHNQLRQHIASGEEKNKSLSGASNMNVLNYNLELEHLARCWFMGKDGLTGKTTHDKCRKTKTFDVNTGQNLAFRSEDGVITKKENFHVNVQLWYDEVTKVSQRLIDRFGASGLAAGHFTQVVWAKATHVGCARGCKANGKGLLDARRCCMVCNYSAKNQSMNVVSTPVYKSGKGCSACEDGKKCNAKYNALCGELETLPQNSLKALPGGSEIPTSAPVAGGGDAGAGGSGGGSSSSGGGGKQTSTAKVSSGNTGGVTTPPSSANDSTTAKSKANIQHPYLQMKLLSILFVSTMRFLFVF